MAKQADQPIKPGFKPDSTAHPNAAHVAAMKEMFDRDKPLEPQVVHIAACYDGRIPPHLKLTLAHRAWRELLQARSST